MAPSKKHIEKKVLEEQKSQQEKSALEGGLVLVDKVFESLKMMLDLYEARLGSNQINKE